MTTEREPSILAVYWNRLVSQDEENSITFMTFFAVDEDVAVVAGEDFLTENVEEPAKGADDVDEEVPVQTGESYFKRFALFVGRR